MKWILTIISVGVLASLCGCAGRLQQPIPIEREYALKPEPHYQVNEEPYGQHSRQVVREDKQTAQEQAIERRFVQPDNSNSAVETALMWSQKYDQLSQKTEDLREQKNLLEKENADLKMRISRMQVELDHAQRELADANEFLEELQLELTQWKKDVLGFREEIRTAQTAQLKALSKILRVLGAEVTEPDMSKPVEE